MPPQLPPQPLHRQGPQAAGPAVTQCYKGGEALPLESLAAACCHALLFWFLAQAGIQDLSCVVGGVVRISTPASPSAAGRPLSK